MLRYFADRFDTNWNKKMAGLQSRSIGIA